MKNIFIILLTAFCLLACNNKTQRTSENTKENNSEQKDLEAKGWQYETPNSGDFDESYGVIPSKGLQDNYFDITVGKGYNVAIKIMDANSKHCIRYVYIPEGQTVTVSEIPQGQYYIKLAYGNDWMSQQTDSIKIGKFTTNAFYEQSVNIYNFGSKNSTDLINYELKINVVKGNTENNFETQPIREQEFLKN